MKKLLVSGLVLAAALATVSPVQAFGGRKKCCCCPRRPCEPMCVTYVDKVVTSYKPTTVVENVTCTVNKLVPREVVTQHTCTVMVPITVAEKRVCTIMTKVPREVVN